MSIEIKQFRKKYDLELIPVSNESIVLGKTVWDAILGKPKFDHPGMPRHIYNALVDADLMPLNELEQNIDKLASEELVDAEFSEKQVDVDLESSIDLSDPNLLKLKGKFDMSKVSNISFGEIQAQVMSDFKRVELDQSLEKLREDKWEEYDGKIRRVFVVTELYYGSVTMLVDKQLEAEFDAAIENTGITHQAKLNLDQKTSYTFNNGEVPFAMRIEKVEKFNG